MVDKLSENNPWMNIYNWFTCGVSSKWLPQIINISLYKNSYSLLNFIPIELKFDVVLADILLGLSSELFTLYFSHIGEV